MDEQKQQEIRAGLEALGPTFAASECGVCDGIGQYQQTYTIGCGMGSYRSMGKCGWCGGAGIRLVGEPAPQSVVNQVREAGRKRLAERKTA